MTTRQLLIWPEGHDLTALKNAVEGLRLPFGVAPHWFEPGKHEGRVLVLADGFNWIHEHIYPKSEQVFSLAVQWALNMKELEHGPHTVESLLGRALGAPATEVFE